jgi:hypothetical protein
MLGSLRRGSQLTGSDIEQARFGPVIDAHLPIGVLAVRCPWAGRKLDFPALCLVAAAVAPKVWADVSSATGVEGEPGWAARARIVAIAHFMRTISAGPSSRPLSVSTYFGRPGRSASGTRSSSFSSHSRFSRLVRTLEAIPSFAWNSSNRVRPNRASRRISSVQRSLILTSLLLAAFVINLDTTIVNVALPSLVRQLHASDSQLQWIVDAFNLLFASSVLAAGSLSDRFGRKGMLLAGLSVFGLASLAGGLTNTPGALIAARSVMGIGAAMVFPSTLSLITNVFSERGERARAIGLWGAITGCGDRARADRGRLATGALRLAQHLLRDGADRCQRRAPDRPLRSDIA